MKPAIGERVGAIRNIENDTVFMFGWGTYEGDHPVTIASGSEALIIPNPRIKLDNGKTVWGFQCWWGREEELKKHFNAKTIVIVDIHDGDVRTPAPN